MGPSILFDKSALQSLGREALHEVNRYFYTVLTPVLLLETLADLSKSDDFETTRKKVAGIANKLLPIDSITNGDYRSLCIHNLLRRDIPMGRKPVVLGAQQVTASDGSKGMVI